MKNKQWDLLLFVLAAVLAAGSNRAPAPAPKKGKKGDSWQQELARRARVVACLPWLRPACEAYGVPLSLAMAVLDVESHGYPNATSPAGAMGYMQLMPKTAKGLKIPKDKWYDPEANIRGGVQLLSQLFFTYQNWAQVLAVYNSGNPDTKKRSEYIALVTQRLSIYKSY